MEEPDGDCPWSGTFYGSGKSPERSDRYDQCSAAENAETLKLATVEAAKESERGIVDIETLQKTNESLISTFDEVMSIQKEGREKRRAAEAEIYRLEGELKQKLLQINH